MITQRVADALLNYETNRNNGNGNNNGNGSHDLGSGSGRTLCTAHGCTYKEFLNCQPLNFKGTKRTVGLAHWVEKMELVFHISNLPVECRVKYATCTLLGGVITWWNSHVRTIGHDAAHEMSWKSLMKMMTEAYCLRNEIQKLENELWNLTVKETDMVERFIWGLPDSIQGNVTSSKLTRLQEAIEIANSLMIRKFVFLLLDKLIAKEEWRTI
ncbi:hypothetical protein Tco_1176576 [Tanacetum coccineum]